MRNLLPVSMTLAITENPWQGLFAGVVDGTPTKRQVSKRQVSKCLVSKRLKSQVYKTSGLQNVSLHNVRFTKRQVFKMFGCKKTSLYILYLWLVEIRRFCCSHVCSQSEGCVLFSILEGFLPYITIISKNDTLFTLDSNANLATPIPFGLISISNLKTGRFETRHFETWRFVNLTFCKLDVLKLDVLKPDILKPDVLWVYLVDTSEQLITGVVDTGDKHSFANIFANFRKNLKWS
jgi:hypothetical protein